MKSVRPKPMGTPPSDLPLTAEEGFVLSRIDGNLSVSDLVALTGLDEPRVEQIVTKLASHGAVALEAEPPLPPVPPVPPLAESGTTSLADFAAVLGMSPTPAPVETEAEPKAPLEAKSSYPPPSLATDATPIEEASLDPVEAGEPAESGVSETHASPSEGDDEAVAEEDAESVLNYRQLYQTHFAGLAADAREHAARSVSGAELCALCLDPEPRVVAAILENPVTGLDQIRLVAAHHRTGTGLEMISRRQDWTRDQLVERRLLRNPQTPETVLARILSPKPLLATYKVLVDRELPELTRTRARGHFRRKWATAAPEERADLMLRTEGRPLLYMSGCTFDARTTQILCGKTIASMLMIQNFAKFSATPPGILAHCMKQAFVRKNPGMKRLLLQHPNMPGEIKRSV